MTLEGAQELLEVARLALQAVARRYAKAAAIGPAPDEEAELESVAKSFSFYVNEVERLKRPE